MAKSKRSPSAAAMARAQALVPMLAELIENNDPALEHFDFNQIEASSAAIGDVVSRVLMKQSVEQRLPADSQEVQAAFAQALKKSGRPVSEPLTTKDRQMLRMHKKRTLKTMRGPVEIEREYLYFPALKAGIFPPRPAP